MLDVLLDTSGDLYVGEGGDIVLTESVRQAVKIRLLWFLGEWRFEPEYGVPYYEEILTKNSDLELAKQAIRDEAVSVEGVLDVRDIVVTVQNQTRNAAVSMTVVTDEGEYREELLIHVGFLSITNTS